MNPTKIYLGLFLFLSGLNLSAADRSSETLKGQKGLFRLMSADILEPGDYHFRTSLEYFQQADLLKDLEKSDVQRTKATLGFGYALTPNVLLSAHAGFDIASRTPKTVGTTSGTENINLVKAGFTATGVYDIGEFFKWEPKRLTAGLALWVDFSKVTRFIDGPNIVPTAIFSTDYSDLQPLPVRGHLNVGFKPANGARYYEDSAAVKDFERFATDTINDWALTTGLGVEFPFDYVNPSVEIHMEKVSTLSFADTPKWVTAGIKGRPFPTKNVELFAGADVGLSSFSATTSGKPAAPAVPLWNVIAGFAVGHFGVREDESIVKTSEYLSLKQRSQEQDVILQGLKKDLEYNAIQGRVIDASTKKPLANVVLSFPESADLKSSRTDADGRFVRYFKGLSGHRLVFSLEGYDSSSKFLAMKPGERLNLDIELKKTSLEEQIGDFVATVTDDKGIGIQAAITFINATTNTQISGSSDLSGNLNMKIPQGTYKVEIKASGYQTATDTLEFEKGKTVLRSYTLAPKAQP